MYLLEKVCLEALEERQTLELSLGALPASGGLNEAQLILEDLQAGHGRAHWVRRGGEKIGVLVTAQTGEVFEVLALRLETRQRIFENFVPQVLEPMATAAGCKFIEFATVRPGFIRAGKPSGYAVSRVYIRKELPR